MPGPSCSFDVAGPRHVAGEQGNGMASLKALKIRIGSVKSTQKITKAMKMVAAAKLRRAQTNAENGRPYSQRLSEVVASLASRITVGPQSPKLIAGTGSDQRHLIVVASSDRG